MQEVPLQPPKNESGCRGPSIAVHPVRTSSGGKRTLKYGGKQAIRLKCTECLGWETHPRECTGVLCPLYPFRGSTRASR
jgi:hypothetical protein